MSTFAAVASPLARLPTPTVHRTAPPLARQPRRHGMTPVAALPGNHLAQQTIRLHDAIAAPLQKTVVSREFAVTMTGMMLHGLMQAFSPQRLCVSLGFMLWPHLVQRTCKDQPVLREIGMQAFNAVIIWGNPCGIALALVAIHIADRLTPAAPASMHQTMRTLAFIGGMLGGARFNPR